MAAPSAFDRVRTDLARAHTLPPRAYSDPEFYALEVEHVLRAGWLPVARLDRIPNPGDYFAFDRFGDPLVAVRDSTGQVRVLSRVCRHRWMPVVEGSGNRKSFQCPYHLWTYGLDGRLVGAPEMQQAEAFDRERCRLPEIRSEIWQGFLFINLDGKAEPLGPQLGYLDELLAPWRCEQLVSVAPLEYRSDWNWKVMVDNFIESYHHMGPHGKTLQPLFPAAGTYGEDVEGPYCVLRNPSKPGSPSAEPGTPLAGLRPEDRTGFTVIGVFPFLLMAVTPQGLTWYEIVPEDVERFTLRIHSCLAADEAANPEAVRVSLDLLRVIHEEDIVACSGVQRGLRSRTAAQGRFSHLEKPLWQFGRWVVDRLEAGGVELERFAG